MSYSISLQQPLFRGDAGSRRAPLVLPRSTCPSALVVGKIARSSTTGSQIARQGFGALRMHVNAVAQESEEPCKGAYDCLRTEHSEVSSGG
jgi:hypothetical protein